MNLMWRFLYIFIVSRLQKKISLFDVTSVSLRVWPTDIDILMHMNNGRYFSLADVARANYITRNKDFAILKKHRIYSVVAAEMIRFKRSLECWQRFEILTEMLGWDDKSFYLVHYFVAQGQLYAAALIRVRCIQKRMPVTTKTVLDLMGHTESSKPLPDWVRAWQDADQDFFTASLRKNFEDLQQKAK